MSRKGALFFIGIYLVAGFAWLVGGNWILNRLQSGNVSADMQFSYAAKNLVFLVLSIIAIIIFLNVYYKRLLSKERLLNRHLRESRDDLTELLNTHKLVIQATSDAIWDYNIPLNELQWLSGYKELFGYEDGVQVKNAFWNMLRVHEEDRERIIKSFEELLAQRGRRWKAEYRYQCLDGSFKYVIDRGYLILDSNNNPIRMLGAMQDIDLIKQYGLQLEQKNEKLKEIAWLNSHEIRRPLCNILSLMPMIRNDANDPELLTHLLDLLEQSAFELDAMTTKINNETSSAKD